MHRSSSILLLLVLLVLSFTSCDRTPRGVVGVSDMGDLIADLMLADAYIDSHRDEFPTDSARMVMKQSVFKKHGITQQDYDTALVWYAHNMEDYIKAYDKAIAKLQTRSDKLVKSRADEALNGEMPGMQAGPTHGTHPRPQGKRIPHQLSTDSKNDSIDMWRGVRRYMLTQGSRRGFITFDLEPDADKQPGDRYQLAYLLTRGGNEFKVSLSIDYTDGSTSQIARSTNSDGWVNIDVQSDTARQVRRIYGYVSYDIKRGHVGYVDSLMLMRTHLSKSNYGFFNAQRMLKRKSD